MILSQNEIGQAISEYLERRGVKADIGNMQITYERDGGHPTYTVHVSDVELPIKEGPYR